ncbi:MAG: biotin/lipoyl-containing protein, partial [Gammaproteobacteria bacterium]
MQPEDIKVPDLGSFTDVSVIEVLVKPGDSVEAETPLLTLETDKATMDVPSPKAGTVEAVLVARGDKVSTGSVIARLIPAAAAAAPVSVAAPTPVVAPTPVSGPPAPAIERGPVPGTDRHAPVLVLGAGPGGYTAAFRAADLGLEVVLVERW